MPDEQKHNLSDMKNQLQEAIAEIDALKKEGNYTNDVVDRLKSLTEESQSLQGQIDIINAADNFLTDISHRDSSEDIIRKTATDLSNRKAYSLDESEAAVRNTAGFMFNFFRGHDDRGAPVTPLIDMTKLENVTTTSDSAAPRGGHLVPELVAAEITKSMKTQDTMMRISRVIPVLSTAPMKWPSTDETSVYANRGETATTSNTDVAFTKATLTPTRIASGIVHVSTQFTHATVQDTNQFYMDCLSERLVRESNKLFTTNSSSGVAPLVAAAASRVDTTATSDEITQAEILNTSYKISGGYARSPQYFAMMNRQRIGELVSDTVSSTDTRLTHELQWVQNSHYGSPLPTFIDGLPLVDNDEVTATKNNNNVIIGDFSRYVITHVPSAMTFQRFDNDPQLSAEGQIGFLVTGYYDGKVVDNNAFRVIKIKT